MHATLCHMPEPDAARRPVDTESTAPAEPPLRIGGELQRQVLGLALTLGCTGETLARYCGATRSAVCRWLSGERAMPAELLARVVALLPWLVVHLRFQTAAAHEALLVPTVAGLERDVDLLVRAALADPRLAAPVEAAWRDVFGALDNAAGRAALAQIAAGHLLAARTGRA